MNRFWEFLVGYLAIPSGIFLSLVRYAFGKELKVSFSPENLTSMSFMIILSGAGILVLYCTFTQPFQIPVCMDEIGKEAKTEGVNISVFLRLILMAGVLGGITFTHHLA